MEKVITLTERAKNILGIDILFVNFYILDLDYNFIFTRSFFNDRWHGKGNDSWWNGGYYYGY